MDEMEVQRFTFKVGVGFIGALIVGWLANGLDGVITAALIIVTFIVLAMTFIEED